LPFFFPNTNVDTTSMVALNESRSGRHIYSRELIGY
jgi:hypothetical protein